MSTRAFVTGATGFLGLNLVQELTQRGWRVTALHRATSDVARLSQFGVERVVGDVTDLDSLRRVMPRGVDVVFHAAGNTSLWSRAGVEQIKVNVKGTRNVVRAALEAGVRRLVHTSSVVAYGLHGGTISEETPTRGTASRINYVRSKALAEREVRHGIRRGLDAVILNPSNMLGAFDTHNWSRLFRLVAQGRLPGVPAGGGSFCHVGEVARMQAAAAERGRTGANYLFGGTEVSYRGLALEMARLLGRPARVPVLPGRLLTAYAWVEEWVAPMFGREPDVTRDAVALLSQNIYCSSRRAIGELGYQPQPLERMLRDCYEWLVGAGLVTAPRGSVA